MAHPTDVSAQFVVMVMDRLQKAEELNSKLMQHVQQLKSVVLELLGNPLFLLPNSVYIQFVNMSINKV